MLKFSNSQSCKEFTMEGEFYRRHCPEISRQNTASQNYIDIYRCMTNMQIVSP
jgi:hypothetical protein